MDEKEEEPFWGWNQPWRVPWAGHVSQGLGIQPSPPPHLSRTGAPKGAVLSLGPQHQKHRRRGAPDQNEGDFPFHFALTTHTELQNKRCPWGWQEKEEACRNVYLSTACEFRTLGMGGHTPQNEDREEGCGFAHSPPIASSPPRSSQLPQPFESPGPLRSFTVWFL